MNDKKLYKISNEGKITGVSAGLAEYFNIDVTLIRVIFIVGALITEGFLVFAYIILAIALPDRDSADKSAAARHPEHDSEVDTSPEYNMRNWIGLAIVALGAWLLLVQFFPDFNLFDFNWNYVWPTLLIIFGLVVLMKKDT